MNGPLDEVGAIEYRIRKYQRGISVMRREDSCNHFKYLDDRGAKPTQRDHILDHAQKIIALKRRLRSLTGRATPLAPKWPL